jgi:hypothetical protein
VLVAPKDASQHRVIVPVYAGPTLETVATPAAVRPRRNIGPRRG